MPPAGAMWLDDKFDPVKSAVSHAIAPSGKVLSQVADADPYFTTQGSYACEKVGGDAARFYFEAEFSGLVGGIGFATLNDRLVPNIYKREGSFLLSGEARVDPNNARSQRSRLGAHSTRAHELQSVHKPGHRAKRLRPPRPFCQCRLRPRLCAWPRYASRAQLFTFRGHEDRLPLRHGRRCAGTSPTRSSTQKTPSRHRHVCHR